MKEVAFTPGYDDPPPSVMPVFHGIGRKVSVHWYDRKEKPKVVPTEDIPIEVMLPEDTDPDPPVLDLAGVMGLDIENLTDDEYAEALRMEPKAHERIPLSNGKRNGLGLRYDHRHDNCHHLSHREGGGICLIHGASAGLGQCPCPFLGGNQPACADYKVFLPLSERPKGPGESRYGKYGS